MEAKEVISVENQACGLSESSNSEELFDSLEPDISSVNNTSNVKVSRPMDIDIQSENIYENAGPGSNNGNNGARSKTTRVANGQIVYTNKRNSTSSVDDNCSQYCEKQNITLHLRENKLTKDSSLQKNKENKSLSLTFSHHKSRPFGHSSVDSTEGDSNAEPKNSEWFHICFICNLQKDSAEELEIHINKDHFDSQQEESDLPRNRNEQSEDKLHICFICNKHLNSTEELQIHINRDHFDSPVKPVSAAISEAAATKLPEEDGGFVSHVGSNTLREKSSSAASNVNVGSLSEYQYLAGHTEAEQSDRLIAEMLQKQYEQEEKEFKKLQDMYGMTDKGNYKKQFHSNLSLAVQRGQISPFEYHMYKTQMSESQATGVDDGVSCTKGIIAALRKYYQQHTKNKDVWLCSDLDHYGGSFGDTGWGCGYRNLQMMLSALAKEPKYQNLLYGDHKVKNGRVASIKKLQQLIERAWQQGFDRQGAEQLGVKLIDTKKWIGATEIVALLSSLKFKCRLVDVRSPSGQQQTHPKMFQWIRDYFKRRDRHEFRSPLYLQHQGHSRTVIGVEESHQNGTITLLVLDPACSKAHMDKLKDRPTPALAQPLRKYLSSMTKDQYQIVAVTGILTDREWQTSKVLKSEKLT